MVLVYGRERAPRRGNGAPRILLCLLLLGGAYLAYKNCDRIGTALDPNPAPARALPAATIQRRHVPDETEERFRKTVLASEEEALK